MGFELNLGRTFTVHFCCLGCTKPGVKDVVVPRVDGAPADVEEFLESALLLGVQFVCSRCGGEIGKLVAVTLGEELSPA